MGMSVDAILCWGIAFEAGSSCPWAEAAEEVRHDDPWTNEALRALLGSTRTLDLVRHCSTKDPRYILTVRESIISSNLGYVKEVSSKWLDVPERWIVAANAEFDRLKISIPDQEPVWCLCSRVL